MDDIRAGDTCFINGRDTFEAYGADLAQIGVGAGKISADYHAAGGSLISYGLSMEQRSLELRFYVFGESAAAREIRTSDFIRACQSCRIVIRESFAEHRTNTSDLHFQAVLTDAKSERAALDEYNEVTLTFAAVACGEEVVTTLPANKVQALGNKPSPCCIRLKPQSAITSFAILGITVKNLKAGDDFFIDGITKRVTRNGLNALSDTSLTAFPTLTPGWNELLMSHEIPGEVIHAPIYV